jgi:iron complex outermembrane receptor protein
MINTTRFRPALIPAAAGLLCGSLAWAQQGATTLDTVSVSGTKQPYRNLSATGATKNDSLIRDLPMSVRVINNEVLKDAGVADLAGALDMSSGVSRANDFGGLWNSYSMRGFTGDPSFGSDYMVNGFNSSRGYNGMRDGQNTQSVEVLKGPSSALYGRGEPGGTVNITTKKPLFQPRYEFDFSVGSFDTYRTAVDLTGPIGETFAWRLNAALTDAHSFRDTVKRQQYLLAPSLLWMVTPDTTLSYEMEAINQKSPMDRGVVAVNGRLGLLPVSRFLGEPGDGPITIESLGHQLFLQHYFNDDWSLQTGVSYRESSLQGIASEAWTLQADGRTLRRMRRLRDFEATDVSGRLELLGKLKTGSIVHNTLVGVDAYAFDDKRFQLRGRSAAMPYTIDIYEPVYGVSVAPAMVPVMDTMEEQRSFGVYAQDQIEFSPKWKALLGLRHDKYEQTVEDRLPGRIIAQKLSATSPRAGLVYQPDKTLSFYVTASRGFRPNSGISSAGASFPAEQSRSYEIGAKWDSADNKMSATVALFDITKENVLTPDPADPVTYSIAVGEMKSRGLEFDFSGEVARNLRLSAAYAYTSAHVTKSNPAAGGTGLAEGRFFPNVPRHSANLFGVYSFAAPGGGKATVGGGISYVGDRLGSVDSNDNFRLPAYTVAKFVSSWEVNKNMRLYFNIDNLFDKVHYVNSYSQLWVAPGTPRKFTLGLTYRL